MTVLVDGRTLTPADVAAVAWHDERVVLADEVLPRLVRDRAVVDDIVDRQVPAYGMTTGLGSRSSYALPREELTQFSVRTIRGRANAVGDPLPVPVVRAALLARVNGIAGSRCPTSRWAPRCCAKRTASASASGCGSHDGAGGRTHADASRCGRGRPAWCSGGPRG